MSSKLRAAARDRVAREMRCLNTESIKHYQSFMRSKTVKMVGKDATERGLCIGDILTEKQIQEILQQHCSHGLSREQCQQKFEIIGGEAKPAVDGIAGFLAEHIRVVVGARRGGGGGGRLETAQLFVKRVPAVNEPKAQFIIGNNYFTREKLMFQLLEEMNGGEGVNPWCAKAYVKTDSLIVMPDLAAEGYITRPLLDTLDLRHVLLTVTSIARFHAAFANYETNKTSDVTQPYDFYREHGQILEETTFQDTPWLRTGAKLTADLVNAFSTRFSNIPGLEEQVAKSFVRACKSLDVAEGTLNVVVHKDLWVNNILYKYDEGGEPVNALLIDYQCVRYGPPAFDLTAFLYLNTTRQFRDQNEKQVFKHYFHVFSKALDEASVKRLDALGYDEEEFLKWCEKSRMFGIFEAVGIFPQVLMDAKSAQKVFDDPDTFMNIVEVDRSAPVVAYAEQHPAYRQRNLEVSEEFVERYVL